MVFLLHDGDLLVDLLLFNTAGVLVPAASVPFGHPAESFRDCTALLSIFFISAQIIFDKFIFDSLLIYWDVWFSYLIFVNFGTPPH